MKKGDKVTIIPNDDHLPHVKKNYGKILEIEKSRISEGETFHKIKGVKDWAHESDLKLCPENITSIWETMSNSELEQKLIDIENEVESLKTSQNTIENVLFYRKNPECVRLS